MKGDEPAFPNIGMMQQGDKSFIGIFAQGMTMRQWYKGMALRAIISSSMQSFDFEGAVTYSGKFADAMVAEDEQHEKLNGK